MHSPTVFLLCLLPSILAHAGETNSSRDHTISTNIETITTDISPISTDITAISTDIAPINTDIAHISTNIRPISTDIAPIKKNIAPDANKTHHHNITDDCAKDAELVQFLEEYTTNIIVLEEEFDRQLYDTFDNLSILLSEGTTKYDGLTVKLLANDSGDANNFIITCKYIQMYSVCSEILKKSLLSYLYPKWLEQLEFGITILNNFQTYINYSQSYFTKRKATVNLFIELYKTWQLTRKLEKQLYQQVLNLSGGSTLQEFMKVLNLETKVIDTISDVIQCINNLESIEAKDRLYNQTIPFALTHKMDIHKWNTTQNQWKRLLSANEFLIGMKSIEDSYSFISQKLHPTILGILFVIGTLENGVLILVFICNKDMRTPQNFPVINLTIADIFTLAMNGLIYTFKQVYIWTLGIKLCAFYTFFENFGITLCMYSVVLVSFQRFLAVTNICKWDISRIFLPKKLTPYVSIAIVWIISACISSLRLWLGEQNTGLEYGVCSFQVPNEYAEIYFYSVIVFMGMVPLVAIAVTSTITFYHMRQSIKNMPGEAEGLKTAVKARALSSRIILALTVVFIISHFPFFAIMIYTSVYHVNKLQNSAHTLFIYLCTVLLTHAMKLLNPCFNPIALYLMSRKYRMYMNKYLTCGLTSRFSKLCRSHTRQCQHISS